MNSLIPMIKDETERQAKLEVIEEIDIWANYNKHVKEIHIYRENGDEPVPNIYCIVLDVLNEKLQELRDRIESTG